LLDSTSCGIDVQVATQCQWLYGTGSRASSFSSASPGVGTAIVLGASSNSEAATAAQRGIDNMVKIDGYWRRQPSLGRECSVMELDQTTWLTWVLYDLGWYRPADVLCPKVNLLGYGERHADLARVVYREPGTGRDGNTDLPRGESCSQGSAVDHPAGGIKSGEADRHSAATKALCAWISWLGLFVPCELPREAMFKACSLRFEVYVTPSLSSR